MKRLKLLARKNQLIYNYNEDKSRLEKKSGLAPRIIRTGFVLFDKIFMSKFFDNQKQVSDEVRERLKSYYKHDIELLIDKYDLGEINWIN